MKQFLKVDEWNIIEEGFHPDNMRASESIFIAQFAGSSSVPAHVEMMGLIGAGNNPMVGMTVAVAVAIEESAKEGKF